MSDVEESYKSVDLDDNKYKLVVIASKRARQLNDGAKSMMESKAKKMTTTAISELYAGLLSYKQNEEEKVSRKK